MTLEALHKEVKPLCTGSLLGQGQGRGLGGPLDPTMQSVHACDEDTETLQSSTCLNRVGYNSGEPRQEVLQRIGVPHGVMESLSTNTVSCQYPCRRTKTRIIIMRPFNSVFFPLM